MSKKRSLQYPGEICRPNERIVEKTEMDIFQPSYAPGVDYQAVQELEKLIRPMKPPQAPRAGVPPGELTPVLVQEIKNSKYKNISFNTAVVRANVPLGLRDMGLIADAITILAIGGGFGYRLNEIDNDLTTAVVGLSETEFEIEEVYLTNAAAVGTAQIRVNWNPFLIRLKP